MVLALDPSISYDPIPATGAWGAVYEHRLPAEIYDGSTGSLSIILGDATGQSYSLMKVESLAAPNRVVYMQEIIRGTFGMVSDEELASVCKVTRKTLHNWRGGIKPRKESMDRLFLLYHAAINWRNAGYSIPDSMAQREAVAGKTIQDLLLADDLDLGAIQFLGSRIFMAVPADVELGNPFV